MMDMVVQGNKKLVPPCSYQGGKQRLAKKIVDIIFEQNEINEDTKFYDLCCGSGAITLELVNRGIHPNNITMVDSGVYGAFWLEVANDEVEIELLKQMVDNIPSKKECKVYLENMSKYIHEKFTYQYLLLQSGSFGGKEISLQDGKWKHHGFRDYWLPTETSIRRSPCNPMQPNQHELYDRVCNIVDTIGGSVRVLNCNVETFLLQEQFIDNTIVYIDPPYTGTTGYSNDLDIMSVVNSIPKNIPVYVSECNTLSDEIYFIAEGRSKGNITGNIKNKRKDDMLNVFNRLHREQDK